MALSNQLLVAVAMVVALLVTSVAGASTCYPFYWNVGDSFLHEDVSMYDIMPGSDTQTGNGCSTPGCKSWTQGVWPTINSKGEKVNGGVPQAANLTLHLETIRQTLPNWIPDPNWDGNAVFDFEAWTPIWAQNIGSGSWHSNVYQKASIELVKAAHPTWNDVKVYAEAGKEFQAAALNFMVETLKLVKSMRPNVKTGFYGLPANPFQPCWDENGQHPKCGYDYPVLGDVWKKENDDVQALWDESTALFPSIYVPPFQTPLATQDYINATVAESVRVGKGTKPTYAFMWSYYHNGTTPLDPADLHSSLLLPHYAGADGVVIWGAPSHHASQFASYLKNDLGPECLAISKALCG